VAEPLQRHLPAGYQRYQPSPCTDPRTEGVGILRGALPCGTLLGLFPGFDGMQQSCQANPPELRAVLPAGADRRGTFLNSILRLFPLLSRDFPAIAQMVGRLPDTSPERRPGQGLHPRWASRTTTQDFGTVHVTFRETNIDLLRFKAAWPRSTIPPHLLLAFYE
jgi:hypothetical protein